jgi:hypothetical protein
MINKKEDQTDLDYFRVPHEKDIAKEFFTKFTTGSEVSRKLYPNSKRKKNVGIVSNCLILWKKLGYIEINNNLKVEKDNQNGTKYSQKIPHYILNLNFFFDYAKKVDFNKNEKELIKSIFSFKELRERACRDKSLIEGIENVLAEIFLISPKNDAGVSRYFLSKFYGNNAKKIIKETGSLYIKENLGSLDKFKSLPKKEKDKFRRNLIKFIKRDASYIRNSWNDEIESIANKILSLKNLNNYESDFYWDIIKKDKLIA